MSAPLEGVLVVALEQAVAAPMASRQLADAGARVIKIERPEGDFARGYDTAAGGLSSYFAWLNQGKESIALDLKRAEDRAVMDGLVARADVFIQNLALGAADRLGYGATALRAARPDMICCDISGYGPDGPRAKMKAYDLLVQAESGLLSVSGAPGAMGRIGVSVADIATGVHAALAISQALVRRARTGEGAHLQTSLFETMAEWMTVPLAHYEGLGRAPAPVGLAHPSIAPYGAFATADGETLLISVQSDREWRVLAADILGDAGLGEDPRFATNAARVSNRAETDAAVARAFAALPRAALEAALSRARIAFGAVNDVAALAVHPQLSRAQVPHELGETSLPAPAVRADWSRTRPVPSLNQHEAIIRREFGETS